jgi:putative inorganic carbon (hco3(-)) transporter
LSPGLRRLFEESISSFSYYIFSGTPDRIIIHSGWEMQTSPNSKFVKYFDTLELFSLGIFVLAGVLSERLLPVAAIAGLVFFLVRLVWQRRVHFFLPIDLPILVLVGMLTLSVYVVTALPEKSIPQALRLINGIWLFYAIARWGIVSPRRLLFLALGLVGVGLALAVGGIFTVRWWAKFSFLPANLFQTLTPLTNDPIQENVLAGSLVLIVSGLAGGVVSGWKAFQIWVRTILLIIIVLMVTVLALTQSRGALLAFGIAILFLIIFNFKRGWLAVPIILFIGIGLIIIFGVPQIQAAFNQIQPNASSPEARLEIWSRAVYMIEDFPLTGIGIGTFNDVADSSYPFLLQTPGDVPHAHNLYLQIMVDLGIPGFIAWISLFILIIILSWRTLQTGIIIHSILFKSLGAALICAQVAIGTHGFLDAVTWGNRPAVIVWAIWGLAIAAYRQSKNLQG